MKSLFITGFLLIPIWLSGQDIIVKKNGEKINCIVYNIDSTRVYYSIDLLKYKGSIPARDIYKIKYDYFERDSTTIYPFREELKIENSFTLGILEGGGCLFGGDYEVLFSNFVGIQVGTGIKGYGAGFDIHFKPRINSSFISLQYWHQGFGNSFSQSLIGPNFVFRGKEWFTFQIGLGRTLKKGPAWPEDRTQPQMMLTYAIGSYFF